MSLPSSKVNQELMQLHDITENPASRFLASRIFVFALLLTTLIANLAVFLWGSPELFQRFGSVNVAVGVALLLLASVQSQRLDRKKTLLRLLAIHHELDRLKLEVIAVIGSVAPPVSPDAQNTDTSFADHAERNSMIEQSIESSVLEQKRELRLTTLLEAVLVLGGTVQWGFGDLLVGYLRSGS